MGVRPVEFIKLSVKNYHLFFSPIFSLPLKIKKPQALLKAIPHKDNNYYTLSILKTKHTVPTLKSYTFLSLKVTSFFLNHQLLTVADLTFTY